MMRHPYPSQNRFANPQSLDKASPSFPAYYTLRDSGDGRSDSNSLCSPQLTCFSWRHHVSIRHF